MSGIRETEEAGPRGSKRRREEGQEGTSAIEQANILWEEKLRELLKCPVCNDQIRPRVDMCRNSHSVCQRCRRRLSRCPVCSARYRTTTKNIMLGHIAEFVKYPCLNTAAGCTETMFLREEAAHLLVCRYSAHYHHCKIEQCDWVGRKEHLKAHAVSNHPSDVWVKESSFAGYPTLYLRRITSDEFTKLIVIEDEMFWMLSKYDSNCKKLFKSFQYVGHPNTAAKYCCEVSLKTSDGKRKVHFSGVVDSDSDPSTDPHSSVNCITIAYETLNMFSCRSEESRLKYFYSVTKDDEET